MHEPRYIQYLNLPTLPNELISRINRNFEEYQKQPGKVYNTDTYWWSDSFNEEVNQWCQQNICAEMYFGFQAVVGDMQLHTDQVTTIKINYILNCGGSNVLTEFFDESHTHKLASYCIEPNRWHIFKANSPHQVFNIEPGQTRFAITGRIFS